MSKDMISTLNHDLEKWHKEEMNELKRSTKYAKKSLLIAGITLIVIILFGIIPYVKADTQANTTVPKSADLWLSPPISIQNNTDFANQIIANGWQGNGTTNNPYIIENYQINMSSNSAYGINIENTNCSFIIQNMYIDMTFYCYGIYLNNVSNAVIFNNTINMNYPTGYGIYLINSSFNTVNNNSIIHCYGNDHCSPIIFVSSNYNHLNITGTGACINCDGNGGYFTEIVYTLVNSSYNTIFIPYQLKNSVDIASIGNQIEINNETLSATINTQETSTSTSSSQATSDSSSDQSPPQSVLFGVIAFIIVIFLVGYWFYPEKGNYGMGDWSEVSWLAILGSLGTVLIPMGIYYLILNRLHKDTNNSILQKKINVCAECGASIGGKQTCGECGYTNQIEIPPIKLMNIAPKKIVDSPINNSQEIVCNVCNSSIKEDEMTINEQGIKCLCPYCLSNILLEKENISQCHGITASGTQCKNHALLNSMYCGIHQKKMANTSNITTHLQRNRGNKGIRVTNTIKSGNTHINSSKNTNSVSSGGVTMSRNKKTGKRSTTISQNVGNGMYIQTSLHGKPRLRMHYKK